MGSYPFFNLERMDAELQEWHDQAILDSILI